MPVDGSDNTNGWFEMSVSVEMGVSEMTARSTTLARVWAAAITTRQIIPKPPKSGREKFKGMKGQETT